MTDAMAIHGLTVSLRDVVPNKTHAQRIVAKTICKKCLTRDVPRAHPKHGKDLRKIKPFDASAREVHRRRARVEPNPSVQHMMNKE